MSNTRSCFALLGTMIGVAASGVAVLQFSTGRQSLPDFLNPDGIQLGRDSARPDSEFTRRVKTVSRSAISDYKTYQVSQPIKPTAGPVGGSGIDLRTAALASRPTGFWRDKQALLLLRCAERECEETQFLKTEVTEKFINAAMDPTFKNVIAFTDRRVVYLDLEHEIFTEAPVTFECNWIANAWLEKPTTRAYEDIRISKFGTLTQISFLFSGWTCVSLTVGDKRLNLRAPVGIEPNLYKSYKIGGIVDQLGVVRIQDSTAIN